jgi:hypothetical protein
MPLDSIPASSQSDGRWKIGYVPTGSNPLSVAILKGASAKNVTYSFTDGGFNWQTAQAEVVDKRLTLDTDLTRPGKKKETLELKYVNSTDADSAAVLFVEGLSGFFVVRRMVVNTTDWTVAQKVDQITFTLGAQRPDAPTENGVDTITQTAYITSVTQRNVALVA